MQLRDIKLPMYVHFYKYESKIDQFHHYLDSNKVVCIMDSESSTTLIESR